MQLKEEKEKRENMLK